MYDVDERSESRLTLHARIARLIATSPSDALSLSTRLWKASPDDAAALVLHAWASIVTDTARTCWAEFLSQADRLRQSPLFLHVTYRLYETGIRPETRLTLEAASEYWRKRFAEISDKAAESECDQLAKRIRDRKLAPYPLDINLELVTYCNSRCRFCTHGALTSKKVRPLLMIDFDEAAYRLLKIRFMTVSVGVPEDRIILNPTGLGEPLLNPILPRVLRFMRTLFPSAFIKLNTNAIALDDGMTEALVDSGLSSIMLSLCYQDRAVYEEQLGTKQYDRVVDNIRRFLIRKGSRSPIAMIHIFKNALNEPQMEAFAHSWGPYLNRNDRLYHYDFMEMVDDSRRNVAPQPCSQIWSILMVDVDGNLFPCCLGIWRKTEPDVVIGNIVDSPDSVFDQLLALRARHVAGRIGSCEACDYVSSYAEVNRSTYETIRKKHATAAESIRG